MTIWADPFCAACGRFTVVRECAIPQHACNASLRRAGRPPSAMARVRLCTHCSTTLGVLPLDATPTTSGRT